MLVRLRGQIIGWGLVLFLFSLLSIARYQVMRDNPKLLDSVLESSVVNILRMFIDPAKLMTPAGFLSLSFFAFQPLVLGAFAVLAGSGLLVADEENGTLDLVLAHPISRTSLLFGRLLAFLTATVVILAVSWLGFILGMTWTALDLSMGAMALPYLSLLALLLFFGSLALLLSLVLPSRRLAAMTTGVVLLSSYFLTTLARMDKGLETIALFTPTHYYQGGDAIAGLNWEWFLGLLAAAGLFTGLAWWCFERRDVRVVGEGTWRWPWQWHKLSSRREGPTAVGH
jgi:ABC-2 type transport system permease protein